MVMTSQFPPDTAPSCPHLDTLGGAVAGMLHAPCVGQEVAAGGRVRQLIRHRGPAPRAGSHQAVVQLRKIFGHRTKISGVALLGTWSMLRGVMTSVWKWEEKL